MPIFMLKNNKGVGIDGIPAELIKHGGGAITNGPNIQTNRDDLESRKYSRGMEQGTTGHYTEKMRRIELCKLHNHFYDSSYEQSFLNVLLNRLNSQTEGFLAKKKSRQVSELV